MDMDPTENAMEYNCFSAKIINNASDMIAEKRI